MAKFKLIRKVVKVGETVEIPDNAVSIQRYDEGLDYSGKHFGAKIYYLEPAKKKTHIKSG